MSFDPDTATNPDAESYHNIHPASIFHMLKAYATVENRQLVPPVSNQG